MDIYTCTDAELADFLKNATLDELYESCNSGVNPIQTDFHTNRTLSLIVEILERENFFGFKEQIS